MKTLFQDTGGKTKDRFVSWSQCSIANIRNIGKIMVNENFIKPPESVLNAL